MLSIPLPRQSHDPEAFACELPEAMQPGWYLARLRLAQQPGRWMAALSFQGPGRSCQEVLLARSIGGPRAGRRFCVFYLNAPAERCGLRLFGVADCPEQCVIELRPVGSLAGALGSLLQNPRAFGTGFRAAEGGVRSRFRRALEVAATRGQIAPHGYAAWCSFFDNWSEQRLRMMEGALRRRPVIGVLVFAQEPGTLALEATLASLRAQRLPPDEVIVRTGAGPAEGGGARAGWVAVLQAGEVVPPHGLLLLATVLDAAEPPAIVFADEDRLDAHGRRSGPVFRPKPSLTFMSSGLLSRGVWLIRGDLVGDASGWAETTRLGAWFALRAAGRHGAARRLPFILTHAREDRERAPPAALARVVDAGLAELGITARVAPEVPLRLIWDGPATRRVSIVIPSRLKGEVQRACIRAVLDGTEYDDFEVLVVVTQVEAFDAEQEAVARDLGADPRVRVERLDQSSFNYSHANNFGVGRTTGEFVLLLNDDVSPLQADWLRRMVSVFSDAHAAIVGAKLYYPDMTTQHGGVGIGFGGLAQHLHRLLPRGAPGYDWRGVVDQELSCVTGACLLVRRSVFQAVGGLDEELPAAFNDVDFCLKVRQAGWGVVLAASVELVHHETITFGHHYGGSREREAADSAKMRARWRDALQEDPFYSPNLVPQEEEEWQLAFPPRVAKPTGLDRPSTPSIK